jgi:hypothetical protein
MTHLLFEPWNVLEAHNSCEGADGRRRRRIIIKKIQSKYIIGECRTLNINNKEKNALR